MIFIVARNIMFETGFLGTQAPLYMDIVTLYFAILPFLLGLGIRFAIKGNYESHYKTQLYTFVTTLLIVVVFEVGVRVSGGFIEFMESSNANPTFMVAFLIFHVFVAILSVVMWSALIYGAIKNYKIEKNPLPLSHKKIGKWVFLGLSATSIMGVMIYYFLFIF
jgi:putative membrane protein